METTSQKPTPADDCVTNSEPKDLPERWSAPRKTELVLRVLRARGIPRQRLTGQPGAGP